MPDRKDRFYFTKKNLWQLAGFVLLFVLAGALLWSNNIKSNQATAPEFPRVCFEGEYRIGEGAWQKVIQGQHIPATKGDVTLRGCFHMRTSGGEALGPVEAGVPIAFYMDHIGVTVYEGEGQPFVMDNENPLFGQAACGQNWMGYTLKQESTEPIEIVIHNPHRYGNETAVDALLSNMAVWVSIDFERNVLAAGEAQRNTGVFFIFVSLFFWGTALFSTLLHIHSSRLIWMLGLVVAFAGGYFIYSSEGISFWSESVTSNTTILGLCMMFYMLLIPGILTDTLQKTQKLARITTVALGAADGLLLLLPMITELCFYDTWWLWAILQNLADVALLGCLVWEFRPGKAPKKWLQACMSLPLLSFGVDSAATGFGIWKGGLVSKYVFAVLLILSLVMVLRIIPRSVNTANKAKALEAEKKVLDAELAQSRIATMISQIRPHFIYNTLGSIEQLCELDPPKAAELVHNFSKYLRGNFGELDNPKPIPMSREMEHVKHYISIENVRFPDMVFRFEMNSGDFELPALTIQPIIENAIKHGLMKLQKGGSISVMSYETDTHYCVSVEDDGVGFDTGILLDERKHIGLRNIRGRLEAMVGGTLEIESRVGVGTKVMIKIPKEAKK